MKNLIVLVPVIFAIISLLLTNSIRSFAELTDKELILYDEIAKTKTDIMKRYGIGQEYLHKQGLLATIENYHLTENEGKILEYKDLLDYKKNAAKDDPCSKELYKKTLDLMACQMISNLLDMKGKNHTE